MEARGDQALSVEVEQDGAVVRIRVRGDLDVATSDDLRKAALGAIESAQSLTIDLTELEFVDSAGLSVLLELRQAVARRGVEFSVLTPEGPVRRAFEITGLGTLLSTGDTE